jgi:hypothetical protein
MNLLLPSAPSGTHGPAGAGDGPHSRREIPDGDFAAALAETAGEGGDEIKRRGARSEKLDDAARLLRAVRRLEAREARAAQGEEVLSTRSGTADDAAAELRLKGKRRSDDAPVVGKADLKVPGEDLIAETRPEPVASGAAAREVLAVLGVDLAARPDRTTAGAELAASMRMTGARGVGLDTQSTNRGTEPGLGEESDVEVVPVRVVRQEKHFQPAGVEMQRWQGAQNVREDASATTLPTPDAKAFQPEAPSRERPGVQAVQARAPEMAASVAQPVSTAGELPAGTVGVQIADRVQQALGSPSQVSAPPPPSGPGHDLEARQTFAPAIRTITLQLNPGSLGTVTIVLSGNDDGLHIQLAAELPDTVTQVENDRNLLTARLNGAGYSVNEITVARLGGQGMDGDARDQGARQGSAQEQFAGNASREGGAQFGGQQGGRGLGGHPQHTESGLGGTRGAAVMPSVAGVSYAGRFRPV